MTSKPKTQTLAGVAGRAGVMRKPKLWLREIVTQNSDGKVTKDTTRPISTGDLSRFFCVGATGEQLYQFKKKRRPIALELNDVTIELILLDNPPVTGGNTNEGG